MQFLVDRDWRGDLAAPDERVQVALSRSCDSGSADLYVEIDAPFHGDPAPPGPPGATPRLWEFEVVEFFVLGAGARYLELEFGPHGHWLALELEGSRNAVRSEASADVVRFEAELSADRWRGRAHVGSALLPPDISRANAYAIHGRDKARRYLAAVPVPGEVPDFHQLEAFAPFDFNALPVRRSP